MLRNLFKEIFLLSFASLKNTNGKKTGKWWILLASNG